MHWHVFTITAVTKAALLTRVWFMPPTISSPSSLLPCPDIAPLSYFSDVHRPSFQHRSLPRETLPLRINASADVSDTPLLPCSSPSAFPHHSCLLASSPPLWQLGTQRKLQKACGVNAGLSTLESSTSNPSWFLRGETQKNPTKHRSMKMPLQRLNADV